MGLPRAKLIAIADQILSPELEKFGYYLDPNPDTDERGWNFEYVQAPSNIDDMYRIVSFQPNGFGVHDFFDIAVNLSRSRGRGGIGIGENADAKEIPYVRLAPCLWQERGAMDYWWHFISEGELEEAYRDILEKLLRAGIPFLNDPDSSFAVWYERGTGRKLRE